MFAESLSLLVEGLSLKLDGGELSLDIVLDHLANMVRINKNILEFTTFSNGSILAYKCS